jgi:Flp pilus assembly protein TadG
MRKFASSADGAAAVEFAFVMPAFLALVIGAVTASILLYSNVSLQKAVEAGARCFSVSSSQCGNVGAAQSYAQSQYHGVSSPVFTASTPSCGHQVAGTVTLEIEAVVINLTLPLSATACFP